MSFQIVGDSCCDYPYLKEDYTYIKRVPLTIELDDEIFVDDETLRSSLLVSKMAASSNAPKSACPAPGAYFEAYDCGKDDIYVVTLSHKLSGSYNSAVIGADMFKEKYKDRNIYVFSSKSAASGEIAICNFIYELASTGMAFEEVVEKTLDFIDKMSTFFVLENLDVLRKNGRLTNVQAIVTSALRLKLVMGADAEGEICACGKSMTIDRAISKMAELISETGKEQDLSQLTLYITQVECPERARKARDLIMKKAQFKDCVILKSGGISTIYANDGGLVVCY